MVRKKGSKYEEISWTGSLKRLAVLCCLTIVLTGCNMFAQTDPDPEFTISSTSEIGRAHV